MTEFIPQNALEIELQMAKAPGGDFNAFLKTFLQSEVYVPSATDVDANPDDFRPVLFDKDGEPLMVVFTAKERAKSVSHIASYGLMYSAGHLIKNMPAGTGLFVNPAQGAGFSMSSTGLARLAQDLG